MSRVVKVEDRIPAARHRIAETGLLLLPALHLVPLLPGESGEECGSVLVEIRTHNHKPLRVNGRILNAVLPFHVQCRVLVVAASEPEVPVGASVSLLPPGAAAADRTDAVVTRKVTEDEVLRAEAAFDEHQRTGSTGKGCPWCGSELRFKDHGQSGYRIDCTFCEFRVTVRGI